MVRTFARNSHRYEFKLSQEVYNIIESNTITIIAEFMAIKSVSNGINFLGWLDFVTQKP